TDFGIAKVATASNLTQTGSTIGTPAYMSPEQCKAGKLTGASDQYSLGVVAYELLTGHPPFAGSPFEIMQAHTSAALQSIRERRPECPPELEAAVFRMLAKNPEERFSDVAEAIEALGGYLPGPQDPIRTDLARLAAPGSEAAFSDREPLRPTPGRAVTPTPSSRTPTPAPAPRRRSRLPLWVGGAVGLAAIVTVGVISFGPSGEEDPGFTGSPFLAVGTITFPNETEALLIGGTVRVRASLLDAEGMTLAGEAVEWSSDAPDIARAEGVNEEVVVTGLAAGTATILARAGGVEESFNVLVSAPAPGELTVSAPRRDLLVGALLNLSAVLTDQTGAEVSDSDITWSSSNSRVGAVDPRSGVVTGRALGRARITATAGDQTGSVSLNVLGRVEAVAIDPPSGPLQAGGTTVL
ncbi:MAG: Ig-like domain-containing protein, partial [Gemmatimonadetes bacterium]|nr:Ig-like domain-containing protein [Gemmatimonadota bacterium]